MNPTSNEDEDDIPQLSSETFSALQEFYKDQEEKEDVLKQLSDSIHNNSVADNSTYLSEDWQLSQFWYDDKTALDLATEVMRLAALEKDDIASIACISCPTLFIAIKKHFPETKCKVKLLEYDKRFATVAQKDCV